MTARWVLVALACAGLSFSLGCDAEGGDDPQGAGSGGKADDADGDGEAEGPLTIYLIDEQPTMRRILSEPQIGAMSRGRTGNLTLDGENLSEDVVLIFSGELRRYDGEVDQVLTAVQPDWISHEEGAANEAGFLAVDFKDTDKLVNHAGGDSLGVHAGVFRGEIIATTDVESLDALPENLGELDLAGPSFNSGPPNRVSTDLHITPVVTLSRLTPGLGDPCLGDSVISRTLSHTDLNIEAVLDGFPADQEVDVELKIMTPNDAHTSGVGAVFDYFWDYWWDDFDVEEVHETVTGDSVVDFGEFTTSESAWGSEVFSMQVQVRASMPSLPSGFAPTYRHELVIADMGSQVVVDQFELCPANDASCYELRDEHSADNVKARRTLIEEKARSLGLYDQVTRPISDCEGGDVVANDFSSACRQYSESQDTELSGRVKTELQFELTVNGKAQGEASWGGSIDGLGTAEIAGSFEAAFSLETELNASFETSKTWREKSSLDVVYNPKQARLQWWRVATPRLRHLEVAEFNECGQAVDSDKIYLTDLRASRLVLACEAVAADDFDGTCHAVEPTADSAEACNDLLLDPEGPDAQACFED